jgi:hypothetical protein
MKVQASHSSDHASPPAGTVGLILLLSALASGPAAWSLQLVAGFGLSSLACYPHDTPYTQSPPPGWESEHAILLAINLACLLVALAGLLVSFLYWRAKRPEKAGQVPNVSETRTRFLGACGMLAGFGFAIAILFDTAAILGVPSCWSIAT